MLWIQNVSYEEIREGRHFDCGDRAILIQIQDPGFSFPWPRHQFAEKHQFGFYDQTDENMSGVITQEQADAIAAILKRALEEERNVVVHCSAGICRSGAVAEVGVMMGFTDSEKFRLPNSLVKRRLIKSLGWSYDESEKELPMTDAGVIIAAMSGCDGEYGG